AAAPVLPVGGTVPAPAVPEPEPPPPPVPDLPAGQGYAPPPLQLLAGGEGRPAEPRQNVQERARILVEALRQFGIEVKLGEVSQGPAITRFEIQPPPGVKVSRIVNLADDIALSLAATGVRIEAPIPGKSAVGIEVPNAEVSPVYLRDVLQSRAFVDSASPLTVALGKDAAGLPMVARLDQMPHLLIAGATGSGKSVLINALITSLLYRAGPRQVQLLLIDPKVVELSVYNGIPHLLAPVVTDARKSAGALRWAVKTMEDRYRRFAEAGVRDIGRYNAQAPEPLPYLVIVIDELADLMMVAPQDVEESIARLAQMARAAGIHLVVATQRPSVDVITGTIKANIPSRIAFAVSSQVDSRTILDAAGAEKLLGRGDMLFHPVGAPKPTRIQGAYVSEAEVEAVTRYLARAAGGESPAAEAPRFEEPVEEEQGAAAADPLFLEALRLVVEHRQASASLLQRRLRVGYSRAARLVDIMEQLGYVGRAEGSRAREVRLSREQFEHLARQGMPAGPGS
ncbi:MAG: DNA translocase FtsK, partial [Firmicutes bacterium]|nr:DNA translocase FtsK [Bacillota bacterium]